MFKTAKQRWQVLELANKSIGWCCDAKTLRLVTRNFETQMREEGRWPFEHPEFLEIALGAYIHKHIDTSTGNFK